jgi:hypothetical protein
MAQHHGGEPLFSAAVLLDRSRRLPEVAQRNALPGGSVSKLTDARPIDRTAQLRAVLRSRLLPTYRVA